MPTFTAKTDGRNTLKLPSLIEEFANQQWIPAHMTDEQALAFVVDQFRRTLDAELQMVEITVQD